MNLRVYTRELLAKTRKVKYDHGLRIGDKIEGVLRTGVPFKVGSGSSAKEKGSYC